ncbi:MAG: site-2 protease family protein [Pirellulales bacterium]|nr:site-2 protease family protein [Pirellulales bacterium]
MLLGEPPRSQWDLNFSLFGFPVRIHPFFWLIVLVLGANSSDPFDLVTWLVAVSVSILFHELGHAVVLRTYGIHPWITLYGLGGAASYNPAQARYTKGSGSLGQILVSLAGPGAGFLLAAVIVGAVIASGHEIRVFLGAPVGLLVAIPPGEVIGSPHFTALINQMLFINVLWGIINLMPVYPLDGGQIAREIFMAVNPRNGIRQSLILSMIAGAALALFGITLWKSIFMAVLFGYLAYTSYATLQAYNRHGPM